MIKMRKNVVLKSSLLQKVILLAILIQTASSRAALSGEQELSGREKDEDWANVQSVASQLSNNEESPCTGELCLYGKSQFTRQKMVKGKTLCGDNGCLLDTKTKSINQELDAAEADSFRFQFSKSPRRVACQGQMCWFRGKKESLSENEVEERLLAQLFFLEELNKRESQIKRKDRREMGGSGCKGSKCGVMNKRAKQIKTLKNKCAGGKCPLKDKREASLGEIKPCVGQMCWFRGKKEKQDKEIEYMEGFESKRGCTGQMCWFRGKKSVYKEENDKSRDLKSDRKRSEYGIRCRGQMCWFRGKRVAINSDARCQGQMCWFRGRKEINPVEKRCQGQMCWFRGKRTSKLENLNAGRNRKRSTLADSLA